MIRELICTCTGIFFFTSLTVQACDKQIADHNQGVRAPRQGFRFEKR